MACGSLPRLTSPVQISCQCNFTASALMLAHSSALRQQSIVPQSPAQRGSFGTPTIAMQRDAAAPMSRDPGGLGGIHWHDVSGARAVWKLWHNLAPSPGLNPQDSGAKLLYFPNGNWLCGHCGSSDHLSPWWWACPGERSLSSASAHQSRGQPWPRPVAAHVKKSLQVPLHH